MFHKGVQLLKNRAPFDAIPYLYASWALDETCLKAANNIAISFWQLNCPDLALRTVEKSAVNGPRQCHRKIASNIYANTNE
ncbi:MAG: hypothetical protein OMM_09423 [Candidatus Magnetoglobus multicellularis str. Araruama]|uniref:Uncharacterized protein n=1 Tax=Candidatus Magnetoglobus multicellularis str. Araruama TaxID=890399 RepID=A0A1V1P4A1_9BACT|nr:MAG: hypothetical protein OMM_09423 [Candidatus Magnetoglobus multicellularis str. Araruama]